MGVIVSEILSANLTDALYTKITNILSVVVERKRLIKHASEIFPRIFFYALKMSRGEMQYRIAISDLVKLLFQENQSMAVFARNMNKYLIWPHLLAIWFLKHYEILLLRK